MSHAAELEHALRENPNDIPLWRRYADELSRSWDPRGELMQVQLVLEQNPALEEQKGLRRREAALIEAHAESLLGQLWPRIQARRAHSSLTPTYRFERGMVRRLSFPSLTFADVEALSRWPHLPFLKDLEVDSDYEDSGALDALAELDLSGLARLRHGDPRERCFTSGARVPSMVHRMKGIEVLEIYSENVDAQAIFSMPLRSLRSLTVHYLTDYPLARLAENSAFKNLEVLDLSASATSDSAPSVLLREGLEALARSSTLERLEVLKIRGFSGGNEVVRALVSWPGFQKLRVLELQAGGISDDGARRLVEAGVGHLEHLDLTGNVLSVHGLARLEATGVRLSVLEQPEFDPIFYGHF